MELPDLFKKDAEETKSDSKMIEGYDDNLKDLQSKTTNLINSLKDDFMLIVELFKERGCDIVSDPQKIEIAYDTSWFSEYRVIKADGIYLHREVIMGGYKLEKRLDCCDVSTSFLILCADILIGMRCKKMICDSDTDYKKILQIMERNKHLTDAYVSSEDKTNFLVRRYNDLLFNV